MTHRIAFALECYRSRTGRWLFMASAQDIQIAKTFFFIKRQNRKFICIPLQVPRIINDIYIIFKFDVCMFLNHSLNSTSLFILTLQFTRVIFPAKMYSDSNICTFFKYHRTPSYIDITLTFNPWRNSQFLFSSGSFSVYIRFPGFPSSEIDDIVPLRIWIEFSRAYGDRWVKLYSVSWIYQPQADNVKWHNLPYWS